MKKTLRDEFALTYVTAILQTPERLNDYLEYDDIMGKISEDAYAMADNMLAARKSSE
jgi:hypothetical protein